MLLIKNKKVSKKVIIIATISALVVVGVVGFIVYGAVGRTNQTSVGPQYTSAEDDQNNRGSSDAKDDTSDSSPLPPQSDTVPNSTSGSVTIGDISQNNGQVTASASTANMSVTSCVYSFTSDGARPVVRETKNGCEQVTIPSVEFEKIGAYTLTVTAYDSTSRVQDSRQVNIE